MGKKNDDMPAMTQLLTREEFKHQTFARTSGRCCCPDCTSAAVDAHHIMDRKLWTDGGYYLSNGAALCAECHLKAERGDYTPRRMIEYMNIAREDLLVPQTLASVLTKDEYLELLFSEQLDKWGK